MSRETEDEPGAAGYEDRDDEDVEAQGRDIEELGKDAGSGKRDGETGARGSGFSRSLWNPTLHTTVHCAVIWWGHGRGTL